MNADVVETFHKITIKVKVDQITLMETIPRITKPKQLAEMLHVSAAMLPMLLLVYQDLYVTAVTEEMQAHSHTTTQ